MKGLCVFVSLRLCVKIVLFRQQICDERFFFLQFILRRGDFGFAEFIEQDVLDEFSFSLT
jgi:hypothetical protein